MYITYYEYIYKILRRINLHLPVIGGGSTTVDGPKNDGISLAVVTGVFKSPVCISATGLTPATVLDCSCWMPDPMLCRRFKCGWLTVVVVLLLVNVWWWCVCVCWCWWWLLKCPAVCDDCCCCCCWLPAVFVVLVWLLLAVKRWLLFVVNDAVVAAVFNRHVSKLSTLKWAAAADSVSRNAWCDGATRVSNPSMIMAVAGGPGALPPAMFQFNQLTGEIDEKSAKKKKKNKTIVNWKKSRWSTDIFFLNGRMTVTF